MSRVVKVNGEEMNVNVELIGPAASCEKKRNGREEKRRKMVGFNRNERDGQDEFTRPKSPAGVEVGGGR